MNKKSRQGEKGFVLIVTLIILAILCVLCLCLSRRAQFDIKASHYIKDRDELRLAIDDTLACVVAKIKEAPERNWPQGFEKLDDVPWNSGDLTIKVRIRETGGGININRLNDELMLLLTGEFCESEQEAKETANCIIDWLDSDNVGTAEKTIYQLNDHDYGPRNAEALRVDELRYVLGMDDLLFYGEDENGNAQLDTGEDQNGDQQLQLGLREYLGDCVAEGWNVNTAPEWVIKLFMKYAYSSDATKVTSATNKIISYRKGPDGEYGTKDDKLFSDESSLLSIMNQVSTSSELDWATPFYALQNDYGLVFENSAWEITVKVSSASTGMRQSARAMVKLDDNDVKILWFSYLD